MTDEVLTQAPEASATAPAETTPTQVTQPRGPDGKFASPPAPEADATTEAAAPETTNEQKPEPKPDEPKRNRVQERIDRVTAEKHAALREAAALRAQLEALQKAPRPQVDPNDYDAVQRESVRGVIREETAQRTADQYQAAVQKAQAAVVETFNAKVDAARERIPDLDRSLQQFYTLPLPAEACEIIAESDVAAELAHYLANNPREAYDIAQMTPAQQGRALARIENRVSLPTRKTTAAPPPVPTVTGAQAARVKTPREETAAEYIARRQREWKEGRR